MTANPFLSSDPEVISHFEDRDPIAKGSLTEVYLAAYWIGKPDESPAEIDVIALRFADPAVASRAAASIQAENDEHARVEPHSAQTVILRGTILCLVGHGSAIDENTWSAFLVLVRNKLEQFS